MVVQNLSSLSVKELRARLQRAGVDYSGCIEKADLVKLLQETGEGTSSAAAEEESESPGEFSPPNIHSDVTNGILPPDIGLKFSTILDILRFGVKELSLFGTQGHISKKASKLINNAADMHLLRSNGCYGDLIKLNVSVFTFWDHDYKGDEGIYNYLLKTAELNPAAGLDAELLRSIRRWPQQRIHGTFFVLCERADGTVLLSEDLSKVYLVLGMAQSLAALLTATAPPGARPLPQRIRTSLLPFRSYLAYDGTLVGDPVPVPPSQRADMERRYRAAARAGTIVAALPPPADDDREPAASAPAPAGKALERAFGGAVGRRARDRLAAAPKHDMLDKAGHWVFRRHGYSEAENPGHLVTLINQAGDPILMGERTRGLAPTPREYLDLLVKAVFDGSPGIPGMLPPAPPTGRAPAAVAVDAQGAVAPLRDFLLPAGIGVSYYPPPTQEELHYAEYGDRALPTGKSCAVCGRPTREDGRPLLKCSRCRLATYCGQDHQRQDWKNHKRACKDNVSKQKAPPPAAAV